MQSTSSNTAYHQKVNWLESFHVFAYYWRSHFLESFSLPSSSPFSHQFEVGLSSFLYHRQSRNIYVCVCEGKVQPFMEIQLLQWLQQEFFSFLRIYFRFCSEKQALKFLFVDLILQLKIGFGSKICLYIWHLRSVFFSPIAPVVILITIGVLFMILCNPQYHYSFVYHFGAGLAPNQHRYNLVCCWWVFLDIIRFMSYCDPLLDLCNMVFI